LIDERLYLLGDWVDDQVRRVKCGIPDDVVFKTKVELAWEMILHAKKNHVPFGWIGIDCFYGKDSWLRDQIDNGGMIYNIADIRCDTLVWLEHPETKVPKRKEGARGRTPTRMKAIGANPIHVEDLKAQLDDSQWNHVFIRDTERRELWSTMVTVRVFPVVDSLLGDECWLIIRKDDDEDKVKYQLSNAPFGY
jgi:SRSO17 transposase